MMKETLSNIKGREVNKPFLNEICSISHFLSSFSQFCLHDMPVSSTPNYRLL